MNTAANTAVSQPQNLPASRATPPVILAIDPGTKASGWVRYHVGGRVLEAGIWENHALLEALNGDLGGASDVLAIERFEARGMAVGDESIVTILWAGRFQQAWRSPESVVLIKRSAVKTCLCGSQRAKDANVRQALIDLLGPPGTKLSRGPTYGVSSHAWAALGVAVTAEGCLS